MKALRIMLLFFASFETALFLVNAVYLGPSWDPFPFVHPWTPDSGILGLLSIYSLPASLGAWALFSLTFFRRQQPRNLGAFASRGFDKNIYNLMVKMRGATSRLSLLRGLETPRHRNDLAEITGIDWKEVDRQINVLEKYGLTKVYASSGSIKLFQLTEQGRLLLQLIDELKLSGS